MSDPARASRRPETTEDFLAWPGEGRARRFELVDGVVRAMAPASTTHATIQGNLAYLIAAHLRREGSGCRLLVAPGVVPRLNAGQNVRVPDLGVTCTADQEKQIAMPEPILLVEILSPSNKAATWTNIWAYSTIPSLQEILIVHSTRVDVQRLQRLPDLSWPQSPSSLDPDQTLMLRSIGLSCPVAALYAETHLAAGRRA